ncbi:CHAT domain-containing protein [Pyxidicoccus fallax]|uniref:CHAT domain-containing protein n=1 Tax=Pyxidicoccus fallax TaxID=394095 RepID=A0A848LEA3_9BACT|nr:CHAT domain-containing protein [Pyxidicoccus fallax]NMO17379.1 CHAT domain-containing protein [Pyxidicoccus fallax]NPC77922.1 CHAT domain-containing protein [Pyxidicoccus fallax]
MSPHCNRLYLFLDGELGAVDEENFRHHLARCEPCASGLHEAMQLELLGQYALRDVAPAKAGPTLVALDGAGAPEPEPVFESAPERHRRVPWWRPRMPWAVGAAVALAASVAGLVFLTASPRAAPREVWLAQAPSRRLEARVAYAPADGHRPYSPMRSGSEASQAAPPLPLRELADLEERGELHGIAAAYLVRGDLRQASDFLQRVPPSPDRDCDLAVIALEQGHPEEALALLEGVLRQVPHHPQALWNRALVLRELGLTLLAAEAFEAVAKQGEPGWSEEALIRARALRQQTQSRGREWKAAFAAVRDLMTDEGARLPLDEARRYPGIVRLAFYDAVRAAPTRDAALRLFPLAEVLDGVQGDGMLRGYVHHVAGRDFARRGPLARDYARLVRGELPEREAFLEAARRSGEDDLYLGALTVLGPSVRLRYMEDFTRLARAGNDAWLTLLAERELSVAEEHAGQWWKAEARLRAALDACQGRGMTYRCVTLRKRLADLYLALNRPAEAFEQARVGWSAAHESGEWELERQLLQELAHIARYRLDVTSARAFLRESLARTPDDCEQRTYVHRNLAYLSWLDFDPKGARRELEQALECDRPLGLPGALMLSYLARFGSDAHDADLLRRTLSELRRGEPTPGELAQLVFAEGQFVLEKDRAEGRELLRDAIQQAEALPDDVDARKTRMGAYNALVNDAGRGGDAGAVLELMGAALRVEAPERCVLAVAVDYERSVVAVRGPSGGPRVHFDASRATPVGRDASGLVPAGLLAVLRGCERVDVLALPPVHGLPGLLPSDLAWSYRVGRASAPPPAGARDGGVHLVVNDVQAPASLRLPELPPLKSPSVPDPQRVELTGARATPSRVLAAMVDASEVELHAHGMFSPEMSDASMVVLAPEVDGRYALTAAQVRGLKLARAPLVLLATCGAARATPFLHESSSLPVAFIEAGAGAVLAATVDIPDTAGRFFEAVRERIRAGTQPALALRDERRQWLATAPSNAWVHAVLLFE